MSRKDKPFIKDPFQEESFFEKHWATILLIVLGISILVLTCVRVKAAVDKGSGMIRSKYEEAKEAFTEKVYQTYYDLAFKKAEEKYHVENDVAIDISSIRETAKLEVLKAKDVALVYQEGDRSNQGITAWLQVPGEGIYTVDLMAGEFIVDDVRHNVLVRLPEPELSEFRIDYGNIEKLEFKTGGIFNKSYKVGEETARKMLSRADVQMKQDLTANQKFYSSAKKTAETMIRNLILQLNPEVTDLQVSVEFYE